MVAKLLSWTLQIKNKDKVYVYNEKDSGFTNEGGDPIELSGGSTAASSILLGIDGRSAAITKDVNFLKRTLTLRVIIGTPAYAQLYSIFEEVSNNYYNGGAPLSYSGSLLRIFTSTKTGDDIQESFDFPVMVLDNRDSLRITAHGENSVNVADFIFELQAIPLPLQ